MKKLTLIGGAPLTGKTTLSRKLATNDRAVEISTDSIRTMMLQLLKPGEYPNLFYGNGKTAEEFYQQFATARSVVDGEIAQGKDVEIGVNALLNTEISWDHLIIEGIALSPSYMKEVEHRFIHKHIECVILVDEDAERIEQRIRNRGLWGPLDTYPSTLIPREVEWVIMYNQWFKEEARKHDIPTTDNMTNSAA